MGIRAQEETRAAVAGRMADRWTNLPQCRPGSVETRSIDPLCGAIHVQSLKGAIGEAGEIAGTRVTTE